MNRPLVPALLICTVVLGACTGKAEEKKPAGPPAALVTVTQAQGRDVDVTEQTVGTVETVFDPTVAAEIAGRIVKVSAHTGQQVKAGQPLALIEESDAELQRRADQAEVRRVQVLLENQQSTLERNEKLVEKGFISPNALDKLKADRDALKNQLESALARASASGRSVGKTRIVAPIDGRVERQIASVGDFVKVGDPLFKLVGSSRLNVNLPFPERTASLVKVGQTVRLTLPSAPGAPVEARVDEIRPMIGENNRAVVAIAKIANPGDWKPGASVNGALVVDRHAQAVVVPEQSVVLRPAGKVVYVVKDGRAQQRKVETGIKQDGLVEVVAGLAAGETVALDGAGYLTDHAALNVKTPAPSQASARDAAK